MSLRTIEPREDPLTEGRERIKLTDKWDKLLAYIIGNLPKKMRVDLELGLRNSLTVHLEDKLHYRNTKQEQENGGVKSYPAIHFDRWIWYATKVS